MRRARQTALAVLLGFAALAALAGSAAAAEPPPALRAAREVLALTKDRLELMDEVMASKWFSRTPIQDPAQEAVVSEAAVAEAAALGVAAAGTRRLFEAEIGAAKEVELGWGTYWLYYGAPPELAAPNLETLRAELSAISKQIVAILPRLTPLARLPKAESQLRKAAARILRVRYLTGDGRQPFIEALLAIPRTGAATTRPAFISP